MAVKLVELPKRPIEPPPPPPEVPIEAIKPPVAPPTVAKVPPVEITPVLGRPLTTEEYGAMIPPPVPMLRRVYPDVPDITFDDIRTVANEDPLGFIADIQIKGRSADTEALLKALDLPDMDIDQTFTPPEKRNAIQVRMMDIEENGVMVRKIANLDYNTGILYDDAGKRIATINPITRKAEEAPPEGFWKDTWDSLMYATRSYFEQGENWLLGVVPNLIYKDIPLDKSERNPIERLLPDDFVQRTNEISRERRDTFRYLLNENKRDYEVWLKDNPEIVPRKEYQEGILTHPELIKDPGYWAHEAVTVLPFIVAAIGVTYLTGGTGVSTVLGLAAMQLPIESYGVYEDAINAGAPEDKAADVALVAGAFISLLESAGRLPFLKMIAPAIFRTFKQEATRGLVKYGVGQAIKKFGIGFTIQQFAEPMTEGAQEIVGNAAVKIFDENRDLLQNVPEVMAKTAIATAPYSFFGGVVSMNPSVRTEMESRVNEAIAEFKAAPEAGAITPEKFLPAEKPVETRIAELETEKARLISEGKNVEASKISDQIKALQEAPPVAVPEARPVEKVTPEVTKPTLEYDVAISGEQVIKTPKVGFEFKVENDFNKFQQLGELAPQTQYDATNNRLMQEAVRGRFATEAELTQVRKLIEAKGLIPRGLVANDVIVTPEGNFKVVDVGNFEVAIPKAEPGMPEAGLQPSMIPSEVAAKEVRPAPKGKIVQISMEDQLKLQELQKATEAEEVGIRAYEVSAEIEGLNEYIKTEPAAKLIGLIKKAGWGKGEITNLTLKQYRDLTGKDPLPNILTSDKKHVRWEYALDDAATELGYADAETLRENILRVQDARIRLAKLEKELRFIPESAKTPLPVLPEPTPEEMTVNLTTTGHAELSPAQVQQTLSLFGKYVTSPSALNAYELTKELMRETRSARFDALQGRVQEIMAQAKKGEIDLQDAFQQAIQETLSGKLPVVSTDYLADLTTRMTNVLFAEVQRKMGNYPGEFAATYTALSNALAGRPIPRKRGAGSILFPKGGSAWDRLNYVFNEQPEALKAIERIAEQKKPLKDVVEGVFREAGQEPIPIDQEMADYLRGLSEKPFGEARLGEEPFALRAALERKTPEQIAQETLELKLELATKPRPPTPFEAPIEEGAKQMEIIPAKQKNLMIRALRETGLTAIDIGNFLRANKASFDFSWWRQQAPLIMNHKSDFIHANIEAWKAMWNQKSAEASWKRITQDPLYQYYDTSGYDFLRPLELPKGTAQWRGVEEFGYLSGERPIPAFTQKIPWVKVSQRAFVTGTNEHNWRIFKDYYNATLRLSEKIATGEAKLGKDEVFDIQSEMTDMAKLLSDLTGRARLGKASGLAPALSAFFFAPRYKLGRILSPRHLISANPRIRVEAWKDLASFVGTTGGIMVLGSIYGLWDVEWDRRSADFMKIRIGNLRIDPWGGYQQLAVFVSRLFDRTGVSSITGQEYEIDLYEHVTNFIKGAQAPLASLIAESYTGKTFIGDEFDLANPKQWADRVAPMATVDMWEAFRDSELPVGVALPVSALAILGAGIQTYTGDWKENFQKLGFRKYPENLSYGQTEPNYDVTDFWADTSSQFKGVDPASLTEKKGYPSYIKSIAEARIIIEQNLDVLPNQELNSLNVDPAKGTTFQQYYQMWQDRQKIVASGDEAKLKEFDQDERTRNAHLGNMSNRDYSLLVQYHSLSKDKQADFIREHPDIEKNPYTEWLRSHPKENAQLAVWGQAKVMSQDAYNEAQRLIKELDIPDNAVADYLPPKDVAKPYFDYLDAIDKFSGGSVQAKLIRATNPKLDEFMSKTNPDLKPIDESVKGLELKVKTYDKTKEYEAFSDKDSPNYKDDVIKDKDGKTAREKVQETFKAGNQAWVEDLDRIEAHSIGTRDKPVSDETINKWVEHGKVSRESKGYDAEEKVWYLDNPVIHKWALENKLTTDDGLKWNEPVLRIQVKPENRKIEARVADFKKTLPDISKKTDPAYKTGYQYAVEQLYTTKEGTAYKDDLERIEAHQNNGATFVEDWVKHGQIVRDTSGNSAEVKVWLYDNKTVHDWAKKNELLKDLDPETDWNIPALRIDVQYRKQDTEYQAILEKYPSQSREQTQATRDYLSKNQDYKVARIQRDGYKLGLTDVSKWTDYNQLPEYGSWRDRYRRDNPDFDGAVKKAVEAKGQKPWAILELGTIPDVRYDLIYEEWKDLFEEYENVQGTDEQRDRARQAILARNPDFKRAIWERNAYGLFIGQEKFVPEYVAFQAIDDKPKPKSEDYKFDDDWYLLEHPEFWNVWKTEKRKTDPDWGKDREKGFKEVPPKRIYELYKLYDNIIGSPQISRTAARQQFRRDYPELDAWLLLIGAVSKSIEQIDRELGMLGADVIAQELAAKRAAIDKLRDEINRKLRAMAVP